MKKTNEVPYFEQHVFICMNTRDDGRLSCGQQGANVGPHAKRRVKELCLNGGQGIRVNQAGCLGRCDEGPVLVVYPQGTWYTYVDATDIDDIIDTHLLGNKTVERLEI